MAVDERELLKELKAKLPTAEEMERAELTVDYDREIDTLYIFWAAPDRPAVNIEFKEHGFLRVDPVTEEVLGLQIEDFLSHVAPEYPTFLALAPFVGISSKEVDRIVKKLPPEQRQKTIAGSLAGSIFGPFLPLQAQPAM